MIGDLGQDVFPTIPIVVKPIFYQIGVVIDRNDEIGSEYGTEIRSFLFAFAPYWFKLMPMVNKLESPPRRCED